MFNGRLGPVMRYDFHGVISAFVIEEAQQVGMADDGTGDVL